MTFHEYKNEIIEELSKTLDTVSSKKIGDLTKAILKAKRIFVHGVGRSGFMMRCFTVRLMHLGLRVYFLGETVTPSVTNEDLLIIGSGSGETSSLIANARKAKEIGCKIALITISSDCIIGKLADYIIEIPAPTAKVKTEYVSVQPMGNLFEQSLLITSEIVIMKLMEYMEVTSDEMFKNHANLE
jgi:6-phospho-3-hexuloisomerase